MFGDSYLDFVWLRFVAVMVLISLVVAVADFSGTFK